MSRLRAGELAQVVRPMPMVYGGHVAPMGSVVTLGPLLPLTFWSDASGAFKILPAWDYAAPNLRCVNCGNELLSLPDEILEPLPKLSEDEKDDVPAQADRDRERETMLHNLVRVERIRQQQEEFDKRLNGEVPTGWYGTLLDDER